MKLLVTLLFPLLLVSCASKFASSARNVPIVGQIVKTGDAIAGYEDNSGSGSLYMPRNYKADRYSYSPDGNGSPDKEGTFDEALRHYAASGDQGCSDFLQRCLINIDRNYYAYLDNLATGRASVDTTMDVISVGLSSAATVINPASTKTILSGMDTFIKGSKTAYQQNFFAAVTVYQQLPKMNERRTKEFSNVRKAIAQKDVLKGINALDRYYFAGSLFSSQL